MEEIFLAPHCILIVGWFSEISCIPVLNSTNVMDLKKTSLKSATGHLEDCIKKCNGAFKVAYNPENNTLIVSSGTRCSFSITDVNTKLSENKVLMILWCTVYNKTAVCYTPNGVKVINLEDGTISVVVKMLHGEGLLQCLWKIFTCLKIQ